MADTKTTRKHAKRKSRSNGSVSRVTQKQRVDSLHRDEANRWIDAALAAGITFERHADAQGATAFVMRYGASGGARQIADVFIGVAARGLEEMAAALAARWPYAVNARRFVRVGIDGTGAEHIDMLRETQTELTVARLQGKADRRGIVYGEPA